MQLALLHLGTSVAIPLFSKAAVPEGSEPSWEVRYADTGMLSPFMVAIGTRISFRNLDMFSSRPTSSGAGASSSHVAHDAGNSTLCTLLIPASTAAMFMLTIFSPFLPYVFFIASFMYSSALSIGMISANLKKAACRTELVLLAPRPISLAAETASQV